MIKDWFEILDVRTTKGQLAILLLLIGFTWVAATSTVRAYGLVESARCEQQVAAAAAKAVQEKITKINMSATPGCWFSQKIVDKGAEEHTVVIRLASGPAGLTDAMRKAIRLTFCVCCAFILYGVVVVLDLTTAPVSQRFTSVALCVFYGLFTISALMCLMDMGILHKVLGI